MDTNQTPIVLLTHDIDILSLRELPFYSKTSLGVYYRLIIRNFRDLLGNRITLKQYLCSLFYAFHSIVARVLPIKDIVQKSTQTMLDIENKYNVKSTWYFITEPFKPGTTPAGAPAPKNRQCYYRLENWKQLIHSLHKEEFEIGVHSLNGHNSIEEAKSELENLKKVLPEHTPIGTRSHWLYKTDKSPSNYEKAGYRYDCTLGWNEKMGLPIGLLDVKKTGNNEFYTVPTHIQDGAVFHYTERSTKEANEACLKVIDELFEKKSKIICLLWHNNSFFSPRYWGDTYEFLIKTLKDRGCQFMTVNEYLDTKKP